MKRQKYSKELPYAPSMGKINLESKAVQQVVKVYNKINLHKVKKRNIPQKEVGETSFYQIESSEKGKRPAILYMHGGGFLFSLRPMMINNATYYSEKLGVHVFLPTYKLLPEYTYPTQLNECIDVYKYIYENADSLNVDKDKIIVYGESAGGALATLLCQKMRDEKYPMPIAQVLAYPPTDYKNNYDSTERYQNAVWSKRANEHLTNMYFKNIKDLSQKYVTPLNMKNLKGLPQAYVEVCGMDILRDEGILYAKKLEEASVKVTLNVVEGAYHLYDKNFDNEFVKRQLDKRVEFMKSIIK